MDYTLFEIRPGISELLLPDSPLFTVVAVSNDFLMTSGLKRETVIGKSHFELFPQSPGDAEFSGVQNLKGSFEHVMMFREPHTLPLQRYDIPNQHGTFDVKYWKSVNVPVLDDTGNVIYIIHTSEDVTHSILSEQRETSIIGIEKAYHFFMNAPVIIGFLKGAEYTIELANEGLLEVWGRTTEVIGKPLMEAIPELQEQGFLALLEQVAISGQPFHAYEFPIKLLRRGQEETLYFDFVYKPFYENDKKERADGIISVGYDVTERVLSKKKVEESEEKYRTLFESMDQGFCVLEVLFDELNVPVDYRFVEVNPVFEKQTGLQDAVGKTALELIPNLERHWFEQYGKVALTGESHLFVEVSQAMGRWFEVYAFKIGGSDSKKVAVLFSNVTERKKAEDALKQSEQNLLNTILQAPVAMAILRGPQFIVEIANERMYELWGREKAALLGKSIFEGLPEVKNQGYEELLNGVFTTGKRFSAYGIPVTLPRNDRIETVYINLLYEAFREADETISGVIAVATEVTDQILARQKIEEVVEQRTKELATVNEALVKSNQELARSNANLEEFAYAASHDMKEPIRKIHFFTDRLKARLNGKLNSEDLDYFERLEKGARRMSTLIDDLLTYSHISRGVSGSESVDLNDVLSIVIDDLELSIKEKNASIAYDQLPVISGHRRQLQQLFENLLGNALKYSKPEVSPQIHIKSHLMMESDIPIQLKAEHRKLSYHLIEIIDNGIGFEPEHADRIFNVFTRLHGNAEYKGTGVGLSIVRKVAENHSGYIWAESQPGIGSTFKLLLPA